MKMNILIEPFKHHTRPYKVGAVFNRTESQF